MDYGHQYTLYQTIYSAYSTSTHEIYCHFQDYTLMCSTHVDTYVDHLSNNHLQLYSPISNGQSAITVPFINGISSFSVI